MNRTKMRGWSLAVAAVLLSSTALGAVTREGSWPDADKPVTVDASGVSRSEAVRRLADAAGWNVVVHAPPGDPVDVHVKNQPAGKVLDLLLADGDYVAKRDGTLVSIDRAPTAAPSVPTAPAAASAPAAPIAPAAPAASEIPAPPAPPPVASVPSPPPAAASAPPPALIVNRKGDDRVVTGGDLRVEKDEVVDDVTVMGGNVDVLGTVSGDLVVIGGSARVHDGARVEGDATAVGGKLDIDDGAEVDGDVGVVGGVLHRAPGAKIHGKEVKGKVKIDLGDHDHEASAEPGSRGWIGQKMRDAGHALTRMALLFVLGTVLLTLMGTRMETLRAEAAARPARSFALGVVGALGFGMLLILLCVTVVGIPVAIIAALLGVFAGYAGVCAVLTTVGQALSGHKTKNPYVHLGVGCVVFLLLGAIPYVGGIVTALVILVGCGVVVATRAAGFVKPRGANGSGPYRTAATV